MSLLSLGATKEDASEQSQSESLDLGYGYTQSGSLSESTQGSRSSSAGQSTSVSGGASQSTSGGVSRSSQDVAFADLFAKLYGDAGGAAGRAAGMPVNEKADMLFNSGAGFLDQLGGGDPASAYLTDRVTGANPLLDEQIRMLGEDVGDFYNNNVDPTLRSDYAAGGVLGGPREQIARSLAAQDATKQFTRGATDLRSADMNRRDAAASTLLANKTASAGVGLGALPGIFGVAQGGQMGELAPYEALSRIMGGGPTVLGQSEASQFGSATGSQFGSSQSTEESLSSSEAISRAIAQALGEDFSFGSSSASASSKSKKRSFDVGFGP